MERKKNIPLLYAIALLHGMVFYAPIATLYRESSGLSVFQITLIESISYLVCIVLEIPWGIVADRIGYKRALCFCCSLYAFSKLIFWRADGFADFLLERILLSVVVAGFSGVDSSVLYLSCDVGESQRVFGIYHSLETLGLLLASLLFSLFLGENYRTAAFLTLLSYGLAAVLSLFLAEVKDEKQRTLSLKDLQAVFRHMLQSKSLLLFLSSAALMTQAHQTITVFLNQIQYVRCGLSASRIGLIYILVTVAGLLGAFSAALSRRLGVKRTGLFLFTVSALSSLLLSISSSVPPSVCGILLIQLSGCLFQPLQAEQLNRQVISAHRATELSVYAIFMDLICAGTGLLFGAWTKLSLEAAFLFGAALFLAGLVLFWLWYSTHPSDLD